MERQDRIKNSTESPYSTANMKTPAIPEGLKGEEQMSAWIAQNRVELVANLMEGEIGEALAQSSAPKQSDAKVIDSKGRARNRLKLSEFMEEQEQQQMQLGARPAALGAPPPPPPPEASLSHPAGAGRRKTQEELEDGLRISVYERKLQTCASKHFWCAPAPPACVSLERHDNSARSQLPAVRRSWHPDVRLSAFWNNLPESEKDEITSSELSREDCSAFARALTSCAHCCACSGYRGRKGRYVPPDQGAQRARLLQCAGPAADRKG